MRTLATCLIATTCVFASTARAQSTSVIFLGGKNQTTKQFKGADAAILAYLEGRYGKANVTFQDTDAAPFPVATDILGYDVAVLSSTPGSGRYRGKLHNSPTPIVNMEEAVADNNGGEFSISLDRRRDRTVMTHAVKITTAHPITKGFAVNSTVTIANSTTRNIDVWWTSNTGARLAPGATSLAVDSTPLANQTNPSDGFLTYVDIGDQLIAANRKAECRRVMFGMTDNTFNDFTAAGKQLFGQAIDWAAGGCCAQSSNYGTGLAGKNGIPGLRSDKLPKWGTTINLIGGNSSGSPAPGALAVGVKKAAIPLLGGTLLTTPSFAINLRVAATGVTLPVGIPDLSKTCPETVLFFQLVQLDTAATQGLSFTPGLRVEFGK